MPLDAAGCRIHRPWTTRRPNPVAFRCIDQRHEEFAKVCDNRSQSLGGGRHAFAAEKGAPLSGPGGCEVVAQANGESNRQGSATLFECLLDRFEKSRLLESERLSDLPEIVEILETARRRQLQDLRRIVLCVWRRSAACDDQSSPSARRRPL